MITSQDKTKSKISVSWRTLYHTTSQAKAYAALQRYENLVDFQLIWYKFTKTGICS